MAKKREWFDDDTLWRKMEPFLFPETSFAVAAKNVRAVLRLARPRGRAVLDQACGPGRYSIPFANRGFQVTGIDRTRYFLNRGRTRARAARARVEWVRADMRDFVRPESFDLALNMFTSFGYFAKDADNFKVLQNLHASLRPRGVCVMELMGKEVLARIWQPTSVQEIGGTKLLNRRRIQGDWDRVWNEWTLIRGARAARYTFDLALYSGRELRDLLGEAGFSEVRLYGSLDGAPYGIDAKRLVVVARKAPLRKAPLRKAPARKSRARRQPLAAGRGTRAK